MATFCDGGHVHVKDALDKDIAFQQLLNNRAQILYRF